MGVSRRELLRFAQVLLTASAVPLRAAGDPAAEPGGPVLLARKSFVPLVNTTFEVSGKGRRTWIALIRVEDSTAKISSASDAMMAVGAKTHRVVPPKTESFVLRFYGSDDSLPQGMYTMSHPALGRFPLFLVPGPLSYTAVINRLVDPRIPE